MKIRKEAWHRQVFLRAYVRDRGWIDGWFEPGNPPADLPERVALREFKIRLQAEHSEAHRAFVLGDWYGLEWTPEVRELEARYNELRRAKTQAIEAWERAERKRYSEERKKETKSRLFDGRTSLCPYFWSVVLALVFYYPVVVPVRGVWQRFTTVVPPFEVIFRGACALIIGLVLYGAYVGRELPGEAVANIKASYAEYQVEHAAEAERELQNKAYAMQRVAERQEWERTHPEELRQEQELQAESERQRKLYAAQARSREWREAKSEFAQIIVQFGLFVLFTFGIVGGAFGGITVLVYLLARLGKLISFPSKAIWERARGSGFVTRCVAVWGAWRQFRIDTQELVAAFIKAKKERVCPFLEFEPEESGENGGSH